MDARCMGLHRELTIPAAGGRSLGACCYEPVGEPIDQVVI